MQTISPAAPDAPQSAMRGRRALVAALVGVAVLVVAVLVILAATGAMRALLAQGAAPVGAAPVDAASEPTASAAVDFAECAANAVPAPAESGADCATDTPAGRQFPDQTTTGVPAGTELTDYTGPCTITQAGTTIDAKVISCEVKVRAADVTIRNSKVNGNIDSGDDPATGYSFTLVDSEVDATPGFAAQVTAVGSVNFTILRSHVYGGNRSVNCWVACTVTDSYLHGQDADETGTWHESGIRMGSGGAITGNTIACDAPTIPPDAGCSAALTGYGDFDTVRDMVIADNLIKATTGGFCAYGGSTRGKPYPDATGMVFTGNVFERGPTGMCGGYGPITDFDGSAPGNVWSANTWDDGTPLEP